MRLSATCFGGPVALVAAMQEDLVVKRKWFREETFQDGMVLSQLAPGPLATQLAVYLGWAQSGAVGAALVGFSLILPSFLIVVAIASLYTQYGSAAWIQHAFLGAGPAVLAIIVLSAWKLMKQNWKADKLLWGIGIFSAAMTVALGRENFFVFVAAGFLYMFWRSSVQLSRFASLFFLPTLVFTGVHGEATNVTLWKVLLYFTKVGAFVFGSGLVIVPFLHSGVVTEFGWLNEQQFMDAIAIAMITPGPVVITVAFIGFLVAGVAGAALACFGVFFPCYLFTVIPAPYFSRWSKNKKMHDFVIGVTAAAIGCLCGAVVILARKTLVGIFPASIFALAWATVYFFKKFPPQILILAAGLLGMFYFSN